ncbi:restriction endonuclease subunit S [Corynebacterium striatum]
MKTAKLANIADIQTGPFGSQLHKEDYVDAGTPIVTVEHLGRRKLSNKNVPFVSESDAHRLSKYSLEQGDIVFSRVGSVDRCSQVSENEAGWLFSGRCLRVRPNDSMIDPDYLYYFLTLPKTQEFIRAIAVGATMPSINTSLLGEVDIDLPPLSEQVSIAKVLGALDDKIAANQRTIRDCESLSEALFRKTSATADITTLGKELELHYGKALPKKSRIPGKVTVVGSGGISGFHNEKLLDGPSIIVGRKGTIGTVHWISGPNYPIDTTFWVESKRLPFELLYFLLKSCDFASMNTDSAVPGLNRKNAYQVAVPWISEDSASEIGPLLKTLRARQEHARKENQVLARTRDELLPLLMSGRITVGEAEEAVDVAGTAASES